MQVSRNKLSLNTREYNGNTISYLLIENTDETQDKERYDRGISYMIATPDNINVDGVEIRNIKFDMYSLRENPSQFLQILQRSGPRGFNNLRHITLSNVSFYESYDFHGNRPKDARLLYAKFLNSWSDLFTSWDSDFPRFESVVMDRITETPDYVLKDMIDALKNINNLTFCDIHFGDAAMVALVDLLGSTRAKRINFLNDTSISPDSISVIREKIKNSDGPEIILFDKSASDINSELIHHLQFDFRGSLYFYQGSELVDSGRI